MCYYGYINCFFYRVTLCFYAFSLLNIVFWSNAKVVGSTQWGNTDLIYLHALYVAFY